MDKKTDNSHPHAKLELRRYMLRKYHSDGQPLHVLDCCQGEGYLWTQLRKEFPIATYLGLDIKPRRGRLRMDSSRYLAQPGWPQNIVDIDTYGAPWRHWFAMLPHLRTAVTVFLTIGQSVQGGSCLETHCRQALGLQNMHRIPAAIAQKLNEFAISYCLTRGYDYVKIIEAVEAICHPAGHARYFGIRLEPARS
jgi:hypothetical protein